MSAKVWYLYNSGFAVQTAQHFLIFDYYLDKPKDGGLAQGVINPSEIKDLDVVVFASHSHYDHFNPVIFEWRAQLPKVRYVLSDDIRTREDAVMVHQGNSYDLGDMSVRVFDSTDIGVAFLVKVDGLCIYHAGDLNWWHWEGETQQYNLDMAKKYQSQINQMAGEQIDLAFVPVDPRLEGSYLRGLDYLMRTVGAKTAVPMHFGEDYSAFTRLMADEQAADYADRVELLNHRGQCFEL
ncbi:MBL fold metallo-hydrolase [Hydrogenoanaerobacterium sp.]|uniref:MBL fold metallo-hydrolase n=1 Tax=Hydrogenoanaerobacterium sp. TaxID=2953763 RepID=UPI00289E2E3A|nr:MBL fold metallo-hydrolase [Hydrogenoanaerobacterium sp.]